MPQNRISCLLCRNPIAHGEPFEVAMIAVANAQQPVAAPIHLACKVEQIAHRAAQHVVAMFNGQERAQSGDLTTYLRRAAHALLDELTRGERT